MDKRDILEGVDLLREILQGITVPAFADDNHLDNNTHEATLLLVDMSVLEMMGSELYPFLIACNGDLRKAAIRIVQTCAWRCSRLRPMLQTVDGTNIQSKEKIDFMKAHGFEELSHELIEEIRKELKARRLFHQGYDESGDPIIYFTMNPLNSINFNLNAMEYAALLIVERALQNASLSRPVSDASTSPSWSRCTLIIVMEQELKAETTKGSYYWDATALYPLKYLALIQRLVPLFSHHYPERLKNVLIVPTSASKSWWGNVIGNVGAFAYVPSARTRQKIHIITNVSDLSQYISLNALIPELKS